MPSSVHKSDTPHIHLTIKFKENGRFVTRKVEEVEEGNGSEESWEWILVGRRSCSVSVGWTGYRSRILGNIHVLLIGKELLTSCLLQPSPQMIGAGGAWMHHIDIKGRIYSACVQSVLIYGTETWAMKADDLRSLERTERMMVRWMCGVSLKDRRRSEDLCNLLGINWMLLIVVRRGRLRWFGHLERKSVDDWVSACRGLVVEGARGRGRSRKTWEQCVRDDMKLLGLHPEWAIFKDHDGGTWFGVKRLTLA